MNQKGYGGHSSFKAVLCYVQVTICVDNEKERTYVCVLRDGTASKRCCSNECPIKDQYKSPSLI